MIEVNECPICGASSFRVVRQAPYFRGDGEKFGIVECEGCGFWMTSPRPGDEDLASYYPEEGYISHSNQQRSLTDKMYHSVRQIALKRKVGLINNLVPERGNLLDFGAGTGHFLAEAQKQKWHVAGVEPSPEARKQARSNFNIDVEAPEEWEWHDEEFNVISLWHVLEHLPQLNEHMAHFHRALIAGGFLIVAVPNHDSVDARHYQEHWAALDVPLHLWHFKKQNLQDLAQKHQFSLQRIQNMPFDSFYVSLLSERIRTGRQRLLTAFWQGLKSNLKGYSDKNMSSLIYIMQKRP